MKKVLAMTLVLSLLTVLLSGCLGGGIKLEENQVEVIFDKDGGITMRSYSEDRDFEDDFEVDFDDDKDDILKDMEDYIEDYITDDFEIKSLKLNKDTAEFEIYFEDAEDLYMELKDTLEDYAEDWHYVDIEDLEDEEDFVYFKDGEDVKGKDLEDYADYLCVNVHGGDEGSYYTFPSKVAIVSEDVKFEKINNNTIFIEDDEYGVVVIEEY